MRNLSIVGKITVFNTLAISKKIHLALVKGIPNSVILELDKIKKHFIWKNGNPKIRQDTLCKDYENGGLKNVDVMFKIISVQCSWVKQLHDSSIHDWKLIPLHMITQKLGKHFLFDFNLYMYTKKLGNFLNIIKNYYQNGVVIYQYHLRLYLL